MRPRGRPAVGCTCVRGERWIRFCKACGKARQEKKDYPKLVKARQEARRIARLEKEAKQRRHREALRVAREATIAQRNRERDLLRLQQKPKTATRTARPSFLEVRHLVFHEQKRVLGDGAIAVDNTGRAIGHIAPQDVVRYSCPDCFSERAPILRSRAKNVSKCLDCGEVAKTWRFIKR